MSNVQDATSELKRQIDEAVASLRARTALVPEVGVILGTGLGTLAEGLTVETRVPYKDIPHFAVSRFGPATATNTPFCTLSFSASATSSASARSVLS